MLALSISYVPHKWTITSVMNNMRTLKATLLKSLL